MIKDLPWWRCGQDPRLGKVGGITFHSNLQNFLERSMALFTQLTLESGEFIGISIQGFLSQSVSVEIRKFIVPKFSC